MGIHPLFAQDTCERLQTACAKACAKAMATELMNISGLWDLDELKVGELLYLLVFGVLEVKDGLDRTGKKNRQKTAKIACTGMCHRMYFLDMQQLDRWLNSCNKLLQISGWSQRNSDSFSIIVS